MPQGTTGPSVRQERQNPFAAAAHTDDSVSDPSPTDPPSRRPRRWFGRLGHLRRVLLAVTALVALPAILQLRHAAEDADKTPQSARDRAETFAAQLWNDLGRSTHAAGMYSELYWRTSSDDERLLVACKLGEADLINALVRSGADVNYRDRRIDNHPAVEWDGATPLMLASKRGRKDLVELLIAKGADLHPCDGTGATALHYAISSGNEALSLYLLEHGADPNAVDFKANATPLGLAFGHQMPRLQQALRARGAHY